jgi:hypothetical protein
MAPLSRRSQHLVCATAIGPKQTFAFEPPTAILVAMNAVISALRDSVTDGDATRAHKLVEDAVSKGVDRQELLTGVNKLMPDFQADEAALDILY